MSSFFDCKAWVFVRPRAKYVCDMAVLGIKGKQVLFPTKSHVPGNNKFIEKGGRVGGGRIWLLSFLSLSHISSLFAHLWNLCFHGYYELSEIQAYQEVILLCGPDLSVGI